MREKLCKFFIIFSLLFFWIQSAQGVKIFILHSYEKNHVCGQPQHDGVIEALRKAGYEEGKNLILRTYYMDTKRKNNTPQLIQKQARIALKRIKEFKPDVLVTLDDNAFSSVALKLVDTSLPIVFSGINNLPEEYNKIVHFMDSRAHPGHNITGVYEKLHIATAFRIYKSLFPFIKKIAILVDVSPTGKGVLKQIKLELKKERVPVGWKIFVIDSWEKFKKIVMKINKDPEFGAIYPAVLLLKDSKNRTHTIYDIASWLTSHSSKPEMAINYYFVRLGYLGGAAVDFFAMGMQAGKKVVQILKGTPPGDIPIEDAQRYALAFNLYRAKQLKIHIPWRILLASDEIVVK